MNARERITRAAVICWNGSLPNFAVNCLWHARLSSKSRCKEDSPKVQATASGRTNGRRGRSGSSAPCRCPCTSESACSVVTTRLACRIQAANKLTARKGREDPQCDWKPKTTNFETALATTAQSLRSFQQVKPTSKSKKGLPTRS